MTIRGTTRVFGVFGDPVAHSLSPLLHAQFAENTQTDTVYVPFHVSPGNLEKALSSLPPLNIGGVNITVPHKEATCELLPALSQTASLIGAVNTVINDNGRLFGENTDSFGFHSDLCNLFPSQPWEEGTVLVIGAGGAARAVIHALQATNAQEIVVANRTVNKAVKIAQELAPEKGQGIGLEPKELAPFLSRMSLLVNTTSLGLKGEEIPGIDFSLAPAQAVVYDLIYNPSRTPLLANAEQHGLLCANGLGMLVRQGAKSFELWTGRTPSADRAIDWLNSFLSSDAK